MYRIESPIIPLLSLFSPLCVCLRAFSPSQLPPIGQCREQLGVLVLGLGEGLLLRAWCGLHSSQGFLSPECLLCGLWCSDAPKVTGLITDDKGNSSDEGDDGIIMVDPSSVSSDSRDADSDGPRFGGRGAGTGSSGSVGGSLEVNSVASVHLFGDMLLVFCGWAS